MYLQRKPHDLRGRKSIFRSLFVPLFLIMILQAGIFFFAAVYGGIEESLNQNAADILSERLTNRANEVETEFHSKWTELDTCRATLTELYSDYEDEHGSRPLLTDSQLQIDFLSDSSQLLINTLRQNEVNGIFLILNDRAEQETFAGEAQQRYGLCIRDMDQVSNYSGTKDLLLERAPSSIVESLDCSLDSWWEARYSFESKEHGDFYYYPLDAAWENAGANGGDLAYVSGVHQLSGSDPAMISYSIPLIDGEGYPYGVVGVEISTRYISSLLPSEELNEADKCCYVLATRRAGLTDCQPVVGTGALFNRCFSSNSLISCADTAEMGGFWTTGRSGVELYGDAAQLNVYNNNNPFDDQELILIALVESDTLFAYIDRIKLSLLIVSIISLALGVGGIAWVSRRFAAPITALASRVRGMETQSDFKPGHLGITEIDQLVDSIEVLNRNVSKNSARTEFFSRMSHDMRTPMNAIISFSSPELLEGATEAEKDDYLQKINASGDYLLGLINDVLDMTKIESNLTELHIESVRGGRLFETTIPIVDKLAQNKGIDFAATISAEDDLYVLADRQHLDQIVMNLLSNAVKFTPPGGHVHLIVRLDEDAADPERVRCRIEVSDTGIGVSEAFMQHLYTPFEQENSGQEGTGLGLSIARKLVDLMDGTIECRSRQNIGTVFTVTIPLAKDRAVQPAAESDTGSAAGDDSALAGKRILVCEDNEVNLMIIRKLLEKKQIIVETATDGRAGVEAFAASVPGTFDAILMDIQMPVMDGLAATAAIRALKRADAGVIPILAMTANAFEEDVRASETAGMNAHMAKPVEPQKLYETLIRFLTS